MTYGNPTGAVPTGSRPLDAGRGPRLAEFSRPFAIERVGYRQDEYLVAGSASAFRLGADDRAVRDRYGSLVHPGDDFSYDIFSQVGRWVRRGLGGTEGAMPIASVLAYGVSQSAYRLTTYVNAVDPDAAAYDGFLVHARGAPAAPLAEEPGEPGGRAWSPPARFRDDLRVPVLCVESETDVVLLGYHLARQPDTDRLRVWEMAGTAHADVYALVVSPIDDGLRTPGELAEAWAPPMQAFGQRLDRPINAGPQHYVTNAALHHLDRWARGGEPPPSAPPLELDGRELRVDELGVARGGVRTPAVDVPIVVLSGVEGRGRLGGLCGATVPLPPAVFAARYPSRGAYLERFAASTRDAIAAGFVLADDVDELVAVAGAFWDLLAAIG